MLVKEGANVKALSLYNSFNYWDWLEDVNCQDDIEILNGDIRDPHYCKNITKDVDIVFHLAVLIAIPYSYIPTIITQIANGAKQIQLGDVTPTRDFNYVEDSCRGFIALAKSEQTIGETINIGSNYEISVKDTLELIKDIMQSDVKFITDEQRIRPENSEVHRLWCDNTKINELTGFEPKHTIKDGLIKTCEWFSIKENLAKYKSDIYNV